ncbi:hypothetical protein [Cohnella boryungensis]|uniref:Uncharacterized protein n=1 Tax=Cohnella boryungensis TaxID=768479 RepID=A0ABV8SAN1_9BACL
MKKMIQLIVSVGLVLGLSLANDTFDRPAAAESAPRISDIIGKDTVLMDDGTLWSSFYGYQTIRSPGDLVSISSNGHSGLGITKSGQLMEFEFGRTPTLVANQTGIKQIAGSYWLKPPWPRGHHHE